MISLTNNTYIRTVGSLPAAAVPGAVTDAQIDAAIILAMGRMIELLGQPAYVALQAWNGTLPPGTTVVPTTDGSVLTMSDQLDRWKFAEGCLAISKLPFSVSSANLSATGIQDSVETGKATVTFASMEEGRKDRGSWEAEAYRWLAPFLTGQAFDSNKVPIGFRNRRKTFFITSCSDPNDPTS